MQTTTFDPKNPFVRKFLLEIAGLPEEIIEDGAITYRERLGKGTPAHLVSTVADTDLYLSEKEAKAVCDLIEIHGLEQITALFNKRHCPGRSSFAAPALLGNLIEKNFERRIFGAIVPEELCKYDDMAAFGSLMLRGIHFDDAHAPKNISDHGKAVLSVTIYDDYKKDGGGSAVIISEDGHVLTARHVLFDESDKLRDQIYITLHGQEILIQEKDILWSEEGKDAVLLHLPALKGRDYLKPAALPPFPSEIVWSIGFPGTMEISNMATKTFTIGSVKYIENDGLLEIRTSVRAAGGYSGGAMINEHGELVGINSYIVLDGLANIIMGTTDATSALMPYDMYSGSPRLRNLFRIVLDHFNTFGVSKDKWRKVYNMVKDDLLKTHPSFVEGTSEFTRHERNRISDAIIDHIFDLSLELSQS